MTKDFTPDLDAYIGGRVPDLVITDNMKVLLTKKWIEINEQICQLKGRRDKESNAELIKLFEKAAAIQKLLPADS